MRHPWHPVFVHFPIGLWTTSLAWDALAWWSLSYWCLAAGLVMALPAIGTGLYEFMRIERGDPAERVILWHMGAMSGASVLFLASLLLRSPAGAPGSVFAVIILSIAGLACLVAGGVLASRLVYGHGVGMK